MSQQLLHAKQLTSAALIAAESPHKEAFTAARLKLANAEKAHAQAEARLRNATTALRHVQTAAKQAEIEKILPGINNDSVHDVSEITETLHEAESEKSLAEKALPETETNLQTARTELESLLQPVQTYLSLSTELERLSNAQPGGMEYYARTAVEYAAAALRRAKHQHPEIIEAAAHLLSVEEAKAQCHSITAQAATVNASMQRALSASNTEANKKGAESTARKLSAATQAEKTAAQAVTAAEAALELTLKAVKEQVNLYAAVEALVGPATSTDAAYRRRQDQLYHERNRSTDSRLSSPCTCSETSEATCFYCRSEQDRRSDWRDGNPCY